MASPPAFGESLTPEECAILDAQSDLGGLSRYDEDRFYRMAEETEQQELATSRTAEEMGRLLGLHPRRVTGLGLTSFNESDSARYPLWQLVQIQKGRCVPLPHLREVLAAVPDDMHPTSLRGLMTTPQTDLVIARGAASPIAWLVLGGTPTAVCDLIVASGIGW